MLYVYEYFKYTFNTFKHHIKINKMRTLSEFGESLIQSFESCELEAYPDPSTKHEPYTIGWGHTDLGVIKKGDMISQAEADAFFREDVKKFSDAVNAVVKVPLNDYQFSALVSLVYNIGPGGLRGSSLLKKLNAGNYIGASNEFLSFVYSNHKKMAGLVNRRKKEHLVFSVGIMENMPDFDKLSSISQYHLTIEALTSDTNLEQLLKDYEEYKKMDLPTTPEDSSEDSSEDTV